MVIVDGRPTLLTELRASSAELQEYIPSEIGKAASKIRVHWRLAGYLLPDASSQRRLGIILKTLQDICTTFAAERKPRMQWEQVGPKLSERSTKVSLIKLHAENENRVIAIVEELARLLSDPRNRPA